MARSASDRGRRRLEALSPWLVLVWVLANYGWTCWFGFVNDDYGWVEDAREALAGEAVHSYRITIFLRPIVDLSFWANYLIAGRNPFGYHLVNVLLECVAGVLVWRLARVTLTDSLTSLIVALLFAVHPSHAGAVAWVCNRSELLSAVFYLGAILLHLRHRAPGAAGLFGIALLSKETAASFPIMGAGVDSLRHGDRRKRIVALAFYGAVLVAYLGLRAARTTVFAWQFMGSPDQRFGMLSLLWNQVTAAAQALLEPLALPPGAASVMLLLALSVAALWASHATSTAYGVRIGSLWIVVSLLPFLPWVRFDPRYAYLPSVGLALLLTGGARGLALRLSGRAWCRWLLSAIAALWLIGSVVALQWRNEQFRRNGVISSRIIDAVRRAVPHPAPRTLFVIDGLGAQRLGRDPWASTPVLLYGLSPAVRLAYGDSTLEAVFPADAAATQPGRPVVRLKWDDQSAMLLQ